MNNLIKMLVCTFFAAIILNACKNYGKQPPVTKMDSLINNPADMADSAHYRGARLIAANDCITCHNIDKKMFGPSFRQIAGKYNNDEKYAEYLTNNVIKGSRGIYGNNAMTPHPNLKYNDIIEMVRYILSVKPA